MAIVMTVLDENFSLGNQVWKAAVRKHFHKIKLSSVSIGHEIDSQLLSKVESSSYLNLSENCVDFQTYCARKLLENGCNFLEIYLQILPKKENIKIR